MSTNKSTTRRAATSRPSPKETDAAPRLAPVPISLVQKVTAWYLYRDEQGEVVYAKTRTGTKQSIWLPSGQAPSGWVFSRSDVDYRRVIYRLPELLDAPANELVVVTEGEKDCDAARDAGWVAVTNSTGAAHWPDGFDHLFAGRAVLLVVDKDEAGLARGVKLGDRLARAGATVTVVWPPVGAFGSGADLSDHFDAGGELFDLEEVPEDLLASMRLTEQRTSGTSNTTSVTARSSERPSDRVTAAGAAAMANEAASVRRAPRGKRNRVLSRAAWRLYRYVAGGDLEDATVTDLLTAAARDAGLPASEIRSTLNSARRAGADQPKQLLNSVDPDVEAVAEAERQFRRAIFLPWGSSNFVSVLLTVLDIFSTDPLRGTRASIRQMALLAGTDTKTISTHTGALVAAGVLHRENPSKNDATTWTLDLARLGRLSDAELVGLRGTSIDARIPSPPNHPSDLLIDVGMHALKEISRVVRGHDAFSRKAYGHAARLLVMQASGMTRDELRRSAGLSVRTFDSRLGELLDDHVLVETGDGTIERSGDLAGALDVVASKKGATGHRAKLRARYANERKQRAAFLKMQDELRKYQESLGPTTLQFFPPDWDLFKLLQAEGISLRTYLDRRSGGPEESAPATPPAERPLQSQSSSDAQQAPPGIEG